MNTTERERERVASICFIVSFMDHDTDSNTIRRDSVCCVLHVSNFHTGILACAVDNVFINRLIRKKMAMASDLEVCGDARRVRLLHVLIRSRPLPWYADPPHKTSRSEAVAIFYETFYRLIVFLGSGLESGHPTGPRGRVHTLCQTEDREART